MALKKAQSLSTLDVETVNQGLCLGIFKKGSQSVVAACAKLDDGKCPAVFDASSCVELKPVGVDVTKGAKVQMF